jgi:hypothetical protein
MTTMFFVKKFRDEKGSVRRCVVVMKQTVFCRLSSGRSLLTFSHSRRKTSQYYAEMTVWPLRTNSL